MDSSIETFWRFTIRTRLLKWPTPFRPHGTLTDASRAWRTGRFLAAIGSPSANGPRATPGQFFTFDLAGDPLIIVRGMDDEFRAFFNVCPTMRPPWLPRPAEWPAPTLPLPWLDLRSGRFARGAPEFASVSNFERAENGLVRCPLPFGKASSSST